MIFNFYLPLHRKDRRTFIFSFAVNRTANVKVRSTLRFGVSKAIVGKN